MQSSTSMQNQNNKNLVWIDGDELVRREGERILNDEIYGTGYTKKLNDFIAQREKALKEFEKKYNANGSKTVESEPGLQ